MSDQIDLEEFLAAASRSFNSAQESLLSGTGMSSAMMLDTAELEVKVSVESSTQGQLKIRPLSLADISNKELDPASFSTLKFRLVGAVSETPKVAAVETGSAISPDKVVIPKLVGKTLKEANAELAAGNWTFEAHAATPEEVAKADAKTAGKVLRQSPGADTVGAKDAEKIHLWVNLGHTPVGAIDGIGDKLGANLEKIGIRSVGELSLANVKELASYLRLNETRTQDFIHMAELMSRLTILGLKDEVVELLTKGVNVRSVEQLAAAKPDKLFASCEEALASGKVVTPKDFKLTKADVKSWIAAAKSAL